MLYSDSLKKYDGEFKPQLAKAIQEIESYFKKGSLNVYEWDKNNIVIASEYNVSLPSRGSVGNLILGKEPILIKISLANYPEIAPMILSNRKNFPKSRLPHLYYRPENEAAALCLVRDNLNQWFATVTIADFLLIGSQWFYKAATGKLLNDNNEFDPTRLSYNLGKHVYKYDTLKEIVINDKRLIDAYPMALLLSSFYDSKLSNNNAFKTIVDIPFVYIDNIKKIISKIYKSVDADDKFMPLYSILIWDAEQKMEEYYFTNIPKNFKVLNNYLTLRGIDLIAILNALKVSKVPIRIILPIIHAIKRPNKIIGYNGDYEFFSYSLVIPENYPEGLNDETEVYISSHAEPFSSELATIISNEKRNTKTLFIGAGSLGSKLIMHDARVGKVAIGAVDNDNFEQHNLGRHVLFSNKIGKNKAEAIIEEVKGFYELDISELESFNNLISSIPETTINQYDLLVDTSASQLVLQNLIQKDLKSNTLYAKCELVDNGEIGLLYIEGNERNPRMDDLVNYACYLATTNTELENWRRADALREPDTLNIGLGCNSITTVMPDDLISFHASTFSQILASNPREEFDENGLLYLSVSRKKNHLPKISNEYLEVKPFEIYECRNNSGWTVRMLSGLSNRLLNLCSQYGRKETGGVLVGVANYKTKVVHVFDIIEQPIDSNGSPVAFTRGIVGLPKQIDGIKLKTGEVIGYIGEWHTHPMNLETLSGTDLNTIELLKEINKKTPIPTCAIIITQTKILPFIYE
jgi:molybdopterin/thiamine biosynthesis adenylyltransferase